jgi:transcriptional regulator with XRE-family HTH domain
MLKGASLLKAIRLWRGISQSKISLVTGIGQGYLSDLENRHRAETPETIKRLASALDVPVTWLNLG